MRKVVQIILFFLLFFLLQTSYAQKVLLEYFDGREIVVYTPDYKLLLLSELEAGDEIPAGSIIETGRKSTCEFRLVPDDMIIKVADRTTLKIEELQGPDGRGKNRFKLMSGAMRAVTGKTPDQDGYAVLCGSSTVYPDKADFGITVKQGWEEIAFVLAGKVKYVNAQGNEVYINADQMAGGLDETFKAEPMSIRIKRLANSLAFSYLRPKDTGSYKEDTYQPTEIPTEEPGPVITPFTTESPVIAPTPEPVITAGPTPEQESKDAFYQEDEHISEDSEKTTAAFDPSCEELYPADEYAFTAKYTYPYNFQIQEVNDEFVIVSFAPPEVEEEAEGEEAAEAEENTEAEEAEEEEGIAEPPGASELPEYTLLEIYNVFEDKTALSGKEVYSGFVDSVFLAKVEDNVFYFSFLWEGAKKNIKPGYYLYPSGRLFIPEEDKIITIKEAEGEDSEEGKVVVLEEELDFSEESRGKTDKVEKDKKGLPVGINVDTGANLSVIVFEPLMLEGVPFYMYLLVSARLRYFINVSIKFTSWFGFGVDAGVAVMYLPIGDIDIVFIDVPLRGFLRFGSKNTYFQPFCGYYLITMGASSDYGGIVGFGGALEVGASFSLGGFYLEGSYVLGELSGGSNYVRAGIGYVMNDILGTGK